jgi:hypothetical protein
MKINGIYIGQLFGQFEIYSIQKLVQFYQIVGVRLNETQIVNHYPNHY